MSTENQMMGFGFQSDSDKDLQSKQGGTFGLNKGFITKFEYNPNGGKDNAEADVFDITVKVGDKEFQSRIFPITRVFDKDGDEIDDQQSQAFINGYNKEMKQMKAIMTHYLKCFTSEEEIKRAFASATVNNFVDYFQLITSLRGENYDSIPVDVFLEFQWKIKGDNKLTFLKLPENMKGGYFIIPHVDTTDGAYKAVVNSDGNLVYLNDKGAAHPFDRSKNFIESPKTIQQFEDGTEKCGITGNKVEKSNLGGGNTTTANALGKPGEAKKSSWGK